MPPHERFIPQLTLLIAGCFSAAGCTSGGIGSRLLPNEPRFVDPSQRVDVQLALGRTFESQQQWDAARTVYSEILQSDPEQAEAAHRLAIVYSLRGDSETSEHWFARALQLDPKNADVLCDWGYSLSRQGDLLGAEDNLRQALAHNPRHQRARNHLGLVLARTDRREEALAEFGKAGCTRSEAHANLVFALATDQQFDRAASELEIARRFPAGSPEQRQRLEAIASLVAPPQSPAPVHGAPQGPPGGGGPQPFQPMLPEAVRSASAPILPTSTSFR